MVKKTEEVLSTSVMVIGMMENGIMIKCMVEEFLNIIMAINMMVSIKTEKNMEWACILSSMVIERALMQDNINKVKNMEPVNSLAATEMFTKVNSKMIICMEKVVLQVKMAISMMVNGTVVTSVDSVFSNGIIRIHIKASG